MLETAENKVQEPKENPSVASIESNQVSPEVHPDVTFVLRLAVSTFNNENPEAQAWNLVNRGFELAKDENGELALRKNGGGWYRFDEEAVSFLDMADYGYEAVMTVPAIVAGALKYLGVAAAVPSGGTSAAAAAGIGAGIVGSGEFFIQCLGVWTGNTREVDYKALVLTTVAGASLPGVGDAVFKKIKDKFGEDGVQTLIEVVKDKVSILGDFVESKLATLSQHLKSKSLKKAYNALEELKDEVSKTADEIAGLVKTLLDPSKLELASLGVASPQVGQGMNSLVFSKAGKPEGGGRAKPPEVSERELMIAVGNYYGKGLKGDELVEALRSIPSLRLIARDDGEKIKIKGKRINNLRRLLAKKFNNNAELVSQYAKYKNLPEADNFKPWMMKRTPGWDEKTASEVLFPLLEGMLTKKYGKFSQRDFVELVSSKSFNAEIEKLMKEYSANVLGTEVAMNQHNQAFKFFDQSTYKVVMSFAKAKGLKEVVENFRAYHMYYTPPGTYAEGSKNREEVLVLTLERFLPPNYTPRDVIKLRHDKSLPSKIRDPIFEEIGGAGIHLNAEHFVAVVYKRDIEKMIDDFLRPGSNAMLVNAVSKVVSESQGSQLTAKLLNFDFNRSEVIRKNQHHILSVDRNSFAAVRAFAKERKIIDGDKIRPWHMNNLRNELIVLAIGDSYLEENPNDPGLLNFTQESFPKASSLNGVALRDANSALPSHLKDTISFLNKYLWLSTNRKKLNNPTYRFSSN